MGNIDKLVVIDQGGGNGEGGGLGRLGKASPAVVFNFLQQLEALGLDVPTVMKQLGVSVPTAVTEPKTKAPTAVKPQ